MMKTIDVRSIVGLRPPVGKHNKVLRELFVILGFVVLTAVMTWPWITSLRNAVIDEGDPYMIAWTLAWDYHQTFTDPTNLFQANVFYPYKDTLAFSEHDYGIALLFFPLFALGVAPLTVQSLATFCGFAFSGYGQFRLTRTLTNSSGAGWIAGIAFAFVPYRFHVLSHLHYLFAGWLPLLLEALVLFTRERSWRRASWLGVAFAMNGLTCVSYFILALPPFLISVAFLVRYYRIANDRALWIRGGVALGGASLVLLPFMLPYYFVKRLYGFSRGAAEVAENSAGYLSWLAAEDRNKVWKGFGRNLPNSKYKLFPGLLPLLLSVPAFLPRSVDKNGGGRQPLISIEKKAVTILNAAILVTLILAMLATGYAGSGKRVAGVLLYEYITAGLALQICLLAVVLRLLIAYPSFLQSPWQKNLVQSVKAYIRKTPQADAVVLALIWLLCGFFGSLGSNSVFNRLLYKFIPLFRAIRISSHWAMIAYVGLAVLAGLGSVVLAERMQLRWPPLRRTAILALLAFLLMVELRVIPLAFLHGKVDPDQLTLKLKQTQMRGGIVELPHDLGLSLPHLYMLRAADHWKPLVNATSSFVSPLTSQIQSTTESGPIPDKFLDLLEGIPASYLVIYNGGIPPERRFDYEEFLASGVAKGRLQYIKRFDGQNDLYAVVKTEPLAKSEAPLPFNTEIKVWDELIGADPINIIGQHKQTSQLLYRLYLATYGKVPRYAQFLSDIKLIGHQIPVGRRFEQAQLDENLQRFAAGWIERPGFVAVFKHLSAADYIDKLLGNSGLSLDAAERASLIEKLNKGELTQASALLALVNEPAFIQKEEARSLVLLHYFGYLRRNPDDPPDHDLTGFNYWLRDIQESGDTTRLTRAFMESIEVKARNK